MREWERLPTLLIDRLPRLATQLLLIAGDVGAYFAAYFVLLPFLPEEPQGIELDRILLLLGAASIIVFASEALYPGYRFYGQEHLRRRTIGTLKVAGLAGIGAILVPGGWPLAFPIVGFLGLGLAIQPATCHLARRLCRMLGVWGERAVIIAGPNRAPILTAHFTQCWQYGIRPESLSSESRRRGRDAAARIALITGDTASVLDELTAARSRFSEIVLLADTPKLRIAGLRPADLNGQIGIRVAFGNRRPGLEWPRRLMDLAIAVPAALLTAPLVMAAGAAIYAIDGGPIFFRQAREGLSGKPVHVLKLRTMYKDAERRLDSVLRADPAMAAEWSKHFKLRKDPRILPVIGHLLRSTSLDELPQLLNVLAGQMAIVGPRPFPGYHLSAMSGEFRKKRRSVTPGLTGLWQISERSSADLDLQCQLDDFYIDNRSLSLDLHILLQTIPAVFRRDSAY
ncbi:exopolysaccharide biosynthesis UDP-galactose-lipid carrier transferase [Aureimonas leprariae]|uniref:Exopolysaccharide biosynthesis UDP-galactose-lipid carrier transferase n=2 Tax=Plantimonas leprariae TaxID=2615207 RepID=A0A7V7PQD8_9HYPH|nr:sugar transferase [Aureimonas leprariae]KAB0680351.1 exopolysaccharide biosynthesis UDP-galactose-lipid carrier transferase [Aureimonas leprariae]